MPTKLVESNMSVHILSGCLHVRGPNLTQDSTLVVYFVQFTFGDEIFNVIQAKERIFLRLGQPQDSIQLSGQPTLWLRNLLFYIYQDFNV